MVDWTEEEIAKRSVSEIKSPRENAARLGRDEIVSRCDAELLRRKPVKVPRPKVEREHRAGHYVSEFHFVCPNGLGVTRNSDGTMSTGIWLVDAANAKAAEKHGALVALHRAKAEPSYIQGRVIGWQKKVREDKYSGDQLTKIKEGVEFLIEPTNEQLAWQGDATGEKGYAWSQIPK